MGESEAEKIADDFCEKIKELREEMEKLRDLRSDLEVLRKFRHSLLSRQERAFD